jgi:hypothetical protein
MGFSNPTMKWTLGVGTALLQQGVDAAKRSFDGLRRNIDDRKSLFFCFSKRSAFQGFRSVPPKKT